jgi:hypothetical protein
MSRRDERERSTTSGGEYSQRQQYEAVNRSIDDTKEGIRRAIEESRREIPRYSQTVTDFQNETADATRDISENFLEAQKEIVNSIQSAWTPIAERTGYWMGFMQQQGGGNSNNNSYWMGGISPRDMADIYARNISALTEYMATSARIATNVLFAGLEAMKTTTNYARQNSKELARVTANTARAFEQNTKETIPVGGSSKMDSNIGYGHSPSASGESNVEHKTSTIYTTEGTVAPLGANTTIKTDSSANEETNNTAAGERSRKK